MVQLTIHSRMPDFRLLGSIVEPDRDSIYGESDLEGLSAFAGLEAMAQLAALHVRYLSNFERHAFLLKAIRCRWPDREVLKAHFSLCARMKRRSSDAFVYDVTARGRRGGSLGAELLIGTAAYGARFREAILKPHYQQIFERLNQDAAGNNRSGAIGARD